MMFARHSVGLFLSMVATLTTTVGASEPHLRVKALDDNDSLQPKDTGDIEKADVSFHPKMEFDFEKGIACKGGSDPKKGGAGKKCEGKMKKSVSVGMTADELTTGIASDMQDMYHDLLPEKDGFLPMEEEMLALIDMDNVDMEEMEDGVTKTIKFGGFFKLNWDCNVTFKKEGLKLSKKVECGGKAVQGMGKGPEEPMNDEDVNEF